MQNMSDQFQDGGALPLESPTYVERQADRDLFLFDHTHRVFYKINRDAPLEAFPKPEELTDEFGQLIFQV